ncbi:MAG: sensor histidine kinase [Solirubrobacteraceae bacterium]
MQYVQHMEQVGLLARRYGLDILILVAAVESAFEVALRSDAPAAPTSAEWFAVPAIGVVVLPLLFRRRFPFAAPAALWLLAAALSFVDGRLVVFTAGAYLAGMVAAFLLGNLRDERQARFGLAVLAGSAAIVVYNDPSHAPGEFVFIPLVFALVWVTGFAVRTRAAHAEAAEQRAVHAEHEGEAAARIAVAEERARIARELHDIVAHAVSVMVLQVGAVRHKLPDAQREDRDALAHVEQAGRAALTEMRRLLDAMRGDDEGAELAPQPGLDRVDALIGEVGRAGLPVHLHVEGEPFALPRGIAISAYRILQEGLTNALKHANASHADVELHYDHDQLRIEVRDDGDGAGRNRANGVGYGLVGIRERVKLYGGEMSAGRSSQGGFVLTMRLPLTEYTR